MRGVLGSFKTLKLWQIGVLAAVLVGAIGGTYGVYALVSGSGRTDLGQNQQLIPVQYGNLVNQVSTNGSLIFPNRQTLTFGTQGTVAEVLVAEGQQVKEGQPLARLDAATIASLDRAVAQARVNLRNAEDALTKAKSPYTSLDLAQAEAKVADARLSLKKTQDALDRLLKPASDQMAPAEAAVTSAKLAVKNAQEALDTVKNRPTADDISKSQSQVDSAKVSLTNAEADLRLAREDRANKVQTAMETDDTAVETYKAVFAKWLGISLAAGEQEVSPDDLLRSWGVLLSPLFDYSLRFLDLGKGWLGSGPPPDNPATKWSEPVIYAWLNLFRGPVVVTCEGGIVPPQGACIKKEMDDAWNALRKANDNLDTVQTAAAKAIASADSAVARAKDSLAAAEEALADLKAGPDPLEVDAKAKQLAVAQATLAKAQDDLANLLGPDPLEVKAKQMQLAVAQATLAKAQDDLAELKADSDPLEVALRQADVASTQTALDTAIQRFQAATLKAPMTGVVSLVNVEAGQAVSANTAIAEVVDPTVVEVDGIVDEIDVLFVRVGARADVTMDALRGQALQGTVSTISSAARSQQGVVSYPVRIRLQVPAGVQLREGLSATASIVIRQENNVLLVPLQALYGTFDQPLVKVMSNGRVEERTVVLGSNDDYWVAVRQGLAEGEQIVMQAQAATTSQFGLGGAMRQFQGQFPGVMPSGGQQQREQQRNSGQSSRTGQSPSGQGR
ncbi:MAG: efflux RND transporter periplasmic adaptor subunit [Chloroflexi bacterium]|nr:efflux RND transporter periplasmic adaptor subunit [Chloroflexota bacterium]